VLKLDREQAIAFASLVFLLVACTVAPIWVLMERSDASQELADGQEMLERLEAAHQRSGGRPGTHEHHVSVAPAGAFLNAATSGLASAQLEAYLSRSMLGQQANLISSNAKQADRADAPDIVRVQVSLEVPYDSLQTLLYKLETGTPYVFVEAMSVQPAGSSTQLVTHASSMKVTMTLRAMWHRPST
jgi:general secretion pathway protein M